MPSSQKHSIQRMALAIEFIESHLKFPIQVQNMADAAAYSIFHFCRLFNGIVHHTPYDYLMRRRLSEAARDLVNSSQKVIEIALDYQFNSPEVFSRAFRRLFSCTPGDYRKHPRPNLPMPQLTVNHLKHRTQFKGLPPEIISVNPLTIRGLITPVKSLNAEPCHHGWQVLWRHEQTGEIEYILTGRRSSEPDHSDSPEVTKTFQYSRFIKWQYENHSALSLSMDYLYHTWQHRQPFSLMHSPVLVSTENLPTLWIPVKEQQE